MTISPRTVIVGDIHGHFDRLHALLVGARLIGADGEWAGGASTLVFLGDFFDRGPRGIDAVDLAMRLEAGAAKWGGRVLSLLGNHDVLILAARRFGGRRTTGPGGTFLADWRMNGGETGDLERMIQAHALWLSRRHAARPRGRHVLRPVRRDCRGSQRGVCPSAGQRGRPRVGPAAGGILRARRLPGRGWSAAPRPLSGALRHGPARPRTHAHRPGHPPGTRDSDPGVHLRRGRAVNVDPGLYLGGPGLVYELDGGK